MFEKKKKVALRVPLTPTARQTVTINSHSIDDMKSNDRSDFG